MSATDLELPGAVVDGVAEFASVTALLAVNRDPAPSEADVPVDAPVRVTVLATGSGAAVTLASVTITVDGVVAYTAEAFQAGFSGSRVIQAANRVDYVVQRAAPFASLASVPVVVAATATAGGPLSASWSFVVEDATPPVVVSAASQSLRVVRVVFDEPVSQGDGLSPGDALYPAAYALSRSTGNAAWLPAYAPSPVSVVAVSSSAVDVTFDAELSPGAMYDVTVSGVEDAKGNAVAPPDNVAAFVAMRPAREPVGRRFDLWRMLPAAARRSDETLALRRFVACLQEAVDLTLADIDAWPDQLDPETADERFVDRMLADLGNPFRFDLDAAAKRRLLAVLTQLYAQAGTAVGIIAAVQFFLGVAVTVTDFTAPSMQLGESQLGVDWVLGPSGQWILYAFEVHSPVALSDAQRSQLVGLVRFLKPAHTHFARLVEPTGTVVVDHWQLGLSKLGPESILH